ncbi:MAG: hypothetical protein M3Z35_13245, partial [Nitrospirota bacterium]|nr:hypothetical protein [Nitrospirota bacterium]
MGPRIPASVRMNFDPALTAAIARYADACNHPQELRIGAELEDVLIDAAHQTFQSVQIAGQRAADTPADVEAFLTLQQSGLQIQTDGLYDRLPTELTLESAVVFRDRSGKVLAERTLKTSRKERIILEPTQHRCAYVSMDGFLHDTTVVLGTQFMREARAVFETSAPTTGTVSPSVPGAASAKPPSKERTVDAVAQTRSPQMSPPASAETPPALSPALPASDTVDRMPTTATTFQQPRTFVISVGISTHRDTQLSVRKYAALDAEMVANYFQTIGGVPPSNIRLLIDMKALRPDIEETILDWLPTRVTADSVVIVYFSGQAKVSASGETFLVPYEGGSSVSRMLPLKDLHIALSRLKARQIVLIFDGSVSKLTVDQKVKSKEPQWDLGGGHIVRFISTTGLRDGLESDKLHHGLFTYYLLRGLKGEADDNLDGEVTLGELGSFVGRSVPAAAKSAFNQEQYPQ